MRIFSLILALGFLLSQCIATRSNDTQIRQAISSLPHCCLTCVTPILSRMHCNLGNLTEFSDCFCNDVPHQKAITECTGHACPFTEIVASEKALQSICQGQPRPTRQPQLYVLTVISSLIVTAFVTLRCYSNISVSNKLWWDDIFLLVSTFCFLAFQSLTIWGTSYGFGVHMWHANTSHWRGLLLFSWTFELLYIIVQTMTKVSVLLLYYRIFPQILFRRLLIAAIIFMFLHCFVYGAIVINGCKPIKFYWNRGMVGKCINIRNVAISGAAFSIGEDTAILTMPLPLIWRLNLKLSRKIGITIILTIGVIAAVASIVRFVFLLSYNQTMDQIWDNFTIVVLSQIELTLSIICVCFPSIRLIFTRSKLSSTNFTYTNKGTGTRSTATKTPESRSKFMSRICGMIPKSISQRTVSIPWISSRPMQLSSIYISSQIELNDENRPISEGRSNVTESLTDSKDNGAIICETQLPSYPTTGIVHVDESGTPTSPVYNNTQRTLGGNDGTKLSPNNSKENFMKPNIPAV